MGHLAGRSLLPLCLLLGAGCPSDPGEEWQEVFTGLPGALISVWGSSSTDVWAVGGDPGDGSGPMVLHYDGAEWTRLPTGTTGDLWWVFGFAGGPVFMGGENGRILRYQGGAFELQPTPGTGTVFGIWGASPTDVWAVGGDGNLGAFAWRYDGAAWTEDPALPAGLDETHSLFKVWGAGPDDVWLVGNHGIALHYDGQQMVESDTGTDRTLFTVHVSGGRAVAVGGFGTGVMLEHDGAGWVDVAPSQVRQTIGVCLIGAGEDGYAVGIDGLVLRRRDGAWAEERTGLPIFDPFHAVWVDPDGGVWAVGGQVLAEPLIDGVLIHKGPPVAGGTFNLESR